MNNRDDLELQFTNTGHLFINPENDPDHLVDWIVGSGYGEEYCFAEDFDPAFIAGLMAAGFLVMSVRLNFNNENTVLLMPKHHILRDVLFYKDLHVTKSARRLLGRYELRAGVDFETIIDKCVLTHGDDWLTPELTGVFKKLQWLNHPLVKPFCFGVYRDGELKAGEFGTVSGRVYTSYSGYHEENSSGTAQMILTAQFLEQHGYAFWDLGMPLPYKTDLGSKTIEIEEFIRLWREGRDGTPIILK
jgi:Leu/Phe-tRNA-protein transferase